MDMTDRDIDRAIDRAVRSMMDVEPAADTTRRVLASLGGGERRPIGWTWAAATAVAAILVLAMVLMRAPGPAQQPQIARDRTPESPAIAERSARMPGDVEPAAPPRARATVPRRAPAPEGHAADATANAIPPLAHIKPLVVPAPAARAIEPEAVVIAPLAAIPDLQVEPLPFAPEARD
jgi:hypothetical protein